MVTGCGSLLRSKTEPLGCVFFPAVLALFHNVVTLEHSSVSCETVTNKSFLLPLVLEVSQSLGWVDNTTAQTETKKNNTAWLLLEATKPRRNKHLPNSCWSVTVVHLCECWHETLRLLEKVGYGSTFDTWIIINSAKHGYNMSHNVGIVVLIPVTRYSRNIGTHLWP